MLDKITLKIIGIKTETNKTTYVRKACEIIITTEISL